MIAIKHRFSGATLCEFDVATVRDAVVKAILENADLSSADLRYADLSSADLRYADLRYADLSSADLRYANLRYADLSSADLSYANLSSADLRYANLDGEKISKNPLSVVGLHYWCLISDGFMRLGCKRFTHAEWSAFSDEQISDMDSRALEFWRQWKAPLLAMCVEHAVIAQAEEIAA